MTDSPADRRAHDADCRGIDIEPIPAFADNYLWLIARGTAALVVDPGDAAPVAARLAQRGLALRGILVTHHHGDHTGGVAELAAAHRCPVFGPARETIPALTRAVSDGDTLDLLDLRFHVLDVPGHTAGHVAYHLPALAALFCGDTLFAAGCGRLLGGTAAQMVGSLGRIARLPPATRIYCAHEYTLANLRFARAVEPDNAELLAREQRCRAQRERGEPTVPSRLAEELATNPFLRCEAPAVRAAAERREAGASSSVEATFAAIRAWKNAF